MLNTPATHPAFATDGRSHLVRGLDAALAACITLATAPLWGVLVAAGTVTRTPHTGWQGASFNRLGWQPRRSLAGRMGWRLGVGKWLTLWHVLKGDLAWVGPRPLALSEQPPPASLQAQRAAVRPGVFSLWQLRQLTSIDYGTEWDADAEQLGMTSLAKRYGLMARCLVAGLYGKKSIEVTRDEVWIDTVKVHAPTMDEALDRIERHSSGQDTAPLQVAFVNPDCVNIARRNPAYRRVINETSLVLPDGIGMRIAGKLLQRPFRQNVNGTDLFPRLCQKLGQRGGRLFLLGARPGVAQAVADWVRVNYPNVEVVGAEHGYFSEQDTPDVVRRIHVSRPDVLLVAMGAPIQEQWIAKHLAGTGARVAMGVGGLFDFYAGRVARAPQWVRELGLEWLFRLLQEPGRMWRRYLLGNLQFLLAVSLQKLLGSASDWDFALARTTETAAPAASKGVLFAMVNGTDNLWVTAGVQPSLLPLGDRPLVMRSLESLASLGCRQVDVLADTSLDTLSEILGDGTRWGMQVRLHRVADTRQGLARLRALKWEENESVVLARADHWLPPQALTGMSDEVVWAHANGDEVRWSGWARVGAHQIARAAEGLLSEEALGHANVLDLPVVGTQMPVMFSSPADVLRSQAIWMSQASFDTLTERSPGVFVSATAHIAPGVQLIAPVAILKGARVSAGAVIGPNAHIGACAVVEENAAVTHSMLSSDTYASKGVQIEDALVLPSGVISSRWNEWLPARWTLAAAGPLNAPATPCVGWAERLLATGLWLLSAAPGFLARAIGGKSMLTTHWLPGLPKVIAGHMALVGVSRPAAWSTSVADAGWILALEQAQPGLVTPTLAMGESLDTPEACAWAEVHWLVNPSWSTRWQLLAAYARKLSRSTAN